MDQNVSTLKAGIRHGVFLGLFFILINFIGYQLGFLTINPEEIGSSTISWGIAQWVLNAIAFFGLGYVANTFYKNGNSGLLSFGNAVAIGAFMGLIAGLFSACWALVYFNILEPNMFGDIMENALEDAGSEEEIPDWVKGNSLATGFTVISSIFGNLIAGVIVGLILGAIMQNDN